MTELRRLVLRRETSSYDSNVDRIVDVCKANGFEIEPGDAKEAWEAYSQSMAAGWMRLPEDDDVLFAIVSQYTEEPSPRL